MSFATGLKLHKTIKTVFYIFNRANGRYQICEEFHKVQFLLDFAKNLSHNSILRV